MNKLKVGNSYNVKRYNESGYEFPEGEYKLKIVREEFPRRPVNCEDEIQVAKEQWLEGLEDTKQYEKDYKGNWYYFKVPNNDLDIKYLWIPESVVIEAFNY